MVPESLPEARRTLGFLLRKAQEELTRDVYARLGEAGFRDVRPAHGAVFRHMPPSGTQTAALAARAGMRKQSMGSLLDDLEAMGYAESASDPNDRRARIVRLTARGKAAQEALTRLSADVEAEWAARIGGREWAATRRTLERLAESFGSAREVDR